jgi:guanylate kinase
MDAPRPTACEGTPANSLLLVIAAPSGAGKTTLVHRLLAARPNLVRAVTCTTRAPRRGEQDGQDYYFFSPAEFERRRAAGEFLEHAQVYGHHYGVLRSELLGKLHQGRDVLLNVDVQGSASIRAQAQADPELRRALVMIFLTPASRSVLEQRLRQRGTDSEDVIARRLAVARQEVAQWVHFDYLLISTTVEEDLRRALVLVEAEKMRQARAQAPEEF